MEGPIILHLKHLNSPLSTPRSPVFHPWKNERNPVLFCYLFWTWNWDLHVDPSSNITNLNNLTNSSQTFLESLSVKINQLCIKQALRWPPSHWAHVSSPYWTPLTSIALVQFIHVNIYFRGGWETLCANISLVEVHFTSVQNQITEIAAFQTLHCGEILEVAGAHYGPKPCVMVTSPKGIVDWRSTFLGFYSLS